MLPTLAFAGQNSSNFGVTFTLLPSCHIKTQATNNDDLKIVSRCSHEDFYITESKIQDNLSFNDSKLPQQKDVMVNKMIVGDETHIIVKTVKTEKTLYTVNF